MALFGSLFDDVLEIVKDWKPKGKYTSESGYRDDLMAYLRKKLNEPEPFSFGLTKKHVIRKESGRHLADIGVDRKVGIELKMNLTKKTQRNRLVGQLTDYMKDYKGIIVVLCGEIREAECEELREDIKRISPEDFFGEETPIKIVRMDKKKKRSGFLF